jgi:protein-tyrosine phosphatase
MLDLHCHILPALDDGAVNLQEALAMARFCVEDGITHIAATPHCNRHLRLLRAHILPQVEHFNEELQIAGIPLIVLPGSEIQLTDTDSYKLDFQAGLFCHLGDGQAFTLLEMNWNERFYQSDTPLLVKWLRARDMTPIVAHPERHGFFQTYPDRLSALVGEGAWLQITVDSLLGNHGPTPQKAGEELIDTFTDIVLSTDAHNIERCSGLTVGYDWVRDRFGIARANEMRARSDEVLKALLKQK